MPATMHYKIKNSIASYNQLPLADHVRQSIHQLFKDYAFKGISPENLYNFTIAEAEAALLEETMAYARNNQCEAAKTLGINRGTFREKLKKYDLL